MNNYKITQAGIDLIKKHEGFRDKPYICPAGKLTVGYGHVILPGENYKKITLDQAIEILIRDITIVENCIKENVKVPLRQNQFDALCSFIFNVGTTAFINSTLLKLINSEDELASNQLLRWTKSRDSKGNLISLKGLEIRRQDEKNLYDTF